MRPILRTFEPIGFVLGETALLPAESAVVPKCVICQKPFEGAPSKMGWVAAEHVALICVCQSCDCSDDELERQILERVSSKPTTAGIAAE